MISARLSRSSAQVAALVRLLAFLLAVASVFIIPSALAAAATHHMATGAAAATTGVACAVTVLASIVARSLDPLRG